MAKRLNHGKPVREFCSNWTSWFGEFYVSIIKMRPLTTPGITAVPPGVFGSEVSWNSKLSFATWAVRSASEKGEPHFDVRLGGGLKHFLFIPRFVGKWSNLTCAYFSDGLIETTNQMAIRKLLHQILKSNHMDHGTFIQISAIETAWNFICFFFTPEIPRIGNPTKTEGWVGSLEHVHSFGAAG